jgi:hypothetical protein
VTDVVIVVGLMGLVLFFVFALLLLNVLVGWIMVGGAKRRGWVGAGGRLLPDARACSAACDAWTFVVI